MEEGKQTSATLSDSAEDPNESYVIRLGKFDSLRLGIVGACDILKSRLAGDVPRIRVHLAQRGPVTGKVGKDSVRGYALRERKHVKYGDTDGSRTNFCRLLRWSAQEFRPDPAVGILAWAPAVQPARTACHHSKQRLGRLDGGTVMNLT